MEYWAILSVREDGKFDIYIPDIPTAAVCESSREMAIEKCRERLCCELFELVQVGEHPFPSTFESILTECAKDKRRFSTHSQWEVVRMCGKPVCMRLGEADLEAERILERQVEQEILNELRFVDRVWISILEFFRATSRIFYRIRCTVSRSVWMKNLKKT